MDPGDCLKWNLNIQFPFTVQQSHGTGKRGGPGRLIRCSWYVMSWPKSWAGGLQMATVKISLKWTHGYPSVLMQCQSIYPFNKDLLSTFHVPHSMVGAQWANTMTTSILDMYIKMDKDRKETQSWTYSVKMVQLDIIYFFFFHFL